jgi:bifunctional NMN adenylyltransferase/nudix hydrolase
METGVIIARFQTPYLHDGHLDLIDKVKTAHNKLIIVLGVSPITGSRKNPYDYHTREKMIKSINIDLVVLPLRDHPDDTTWSMHLDQLLTQTFPTEAFMLYGSRDSFIPHYRGKNATVELAEYGDHNATVLRAQCTDKVIDSQEFRAGILYACHHQYTKVYPTVDVAIFRNNSTEILLGKKALNNQWRLIGGFADPEDNSYEEAAKRELIEECGPIEVGKLTYETSMKIDDWRYKPEADKIITTLFSCDFQYGIPKAQDDIDALQWFKVDDLIHMLDKSAISEEHEDLIQFLIDQYTTCLTLKLEGHETK